MDTLDVNYLVNVEVKVKMMQGIHTFRRDSTSKLSSVIPGAPGSILPLSHPEDENLPRTRREAWSKAQAPTPSSTTTIPAMTSPTKYQLHH